MNCSRRFHLWRVFVSLVFRKIEKGVFVCIYMKLLELFVTYGPLTFRYTNLSPKVNWQTCVTSRYTSVNITYEVLTKG